MEGIGFLKAAHASQQVSAMVIRGISDLIDSKGDADAQGYQEIAARHASAFAFQVLAKLIVEKHSEDNSTGEIESPGRLKRQLRHLENDISEKEEEEKDLNNKIEVVGNQSRNVLEDLQKYKLEKKQKELKQNRETIRQERHELDDKKDLIQQKLGDLP